MSNAAIVEKFKELNLSPYEIRCYLSLLEKHTLSVVEIAKIAGIPRANAYEALEKLLAKGFCLSKPGKKRKYSASDPSSLKKKVLEALDRSFEDRLNKLYEKQKEILSGKKAARENVTNLLDTLTPIYENSRSNGTPLEYIEIIKDPHQVNRRFMDLVAQAEEEILRFSKPPYSVNREGMQEQAELQVSKCEKNMIRNKGIHEIPKTKEDILWMFEHIDRNIKKATSGNDELRVIKELPMKMAIFDEKIAMFQLRDPVLAATTFTLQVVEHPALAKSLKMLFYHVWEQAEDYHVLEDLLKKM